MMPVGNGALLGGDEHDERKLSADAEPDTFWLHTPFFSYEVINDSPVDSTHSMPHGFRISA